MAAGDVHVHIQSVDKVAGTELTNADLYTATVIAGSTSSITTAVFPRSTNGTIVTYDIITTVTELS